MDEIVNLADIARRVGVSRQAVWELSRRDPAFPHPLPTPSRNRLYAWPAVRDYYQARGIDVGGCEAVRVLFGGACPDHDPLPATAPDPGKEPS